MYSSQHSSSLAKFLKRIQREKERVHATDIHSQRLDFNIDKCVTQNLINHSQLSSKKNEKRIIDVKNMRQELLMSITFRKGRSSAFQLFW